MGKKWERYGDIVLFLDMTGLHLNGGTLVVSFYIKNSNISTETVST